MPSKPINVRSLADADPTYAAAKSLVARLSAQSTKLDNEESGLLDRLRNRSPEPEKTSRVAALLGDAAPDSESEPDGLSARLKAIAGERVDLRAAIAIANERVMLARFAASKTVAGEVRPEYAARVKRLAKALIEAAAANGALVQIVDEMNAEDVAWSGHMAPMQATYMVGERGDRVAAWLKEAREAGFVSTNDIPEELR